MRKMEKEATSRPFQKLYPLQLSPEWDNNEPPPGTNNIKIEESKSWTDPDSTEGDLGRSYAEGRSKSQQVAAFDGDMKQR